MKINLQSKENSFILNGTEYPKGSFPISYRIAGNISIGNVNSTLEDITADGETFTDLDELKTWISANLFSNGGSAGGNGGSGWAIYNDNQYTQSSPLVINEGVTTKITINGSTSIKDQLPNGVSDWWNSTTNKITPSLSGDSYIVNLRFIATSSSNTGLADVEIDIGGTLNVIDGSTVSLRKGTGNTQRVSLKFDLYTASTFIANGGEIKLRSIDGNTSIYNISVKITRVHKQKSNTL